MARYIDVDKEIKEIKTVLDTKRTAGDDEDNLGFYALMQFAEMLRNAPTADVAPVVHAHRMLESNGSAVCSNCYHLDEIDPLANFCRYCGAEFKEG